MNITFAQYKNDDDGNASLIKAEIDGLQMFIPTKQSNRHYKEIMNQVNEGKLTIEPDSGPTDEQLASKARFERDRLLKDSDWTQVSDAPVDQDVWAKYRQALRDVPQQTGFPTDINWPTKPE